MERLDAAKDALRAVEIALKFFRGNCQENRAGYIECGMVDELKTIRDRWIGYYLEGEQQCASSSPSTS